MARSRRLVPSVYIRNEITAMINAGYTSATALAQIRQRFRGHNVILLRQEVNAAILRHAAAQRMQALQNNQVINIGQTAGCRPGQHARIHLAVTYTDPQTGVVRVFDHSVDVRGRARWDTFQARMMTLVQEEAEHWGYRIPSYQTLLGDPAFNIRFLSVRCV